MESRFGGPERYLKGSYREKEGGSDELMGTMLILGALVGVSAFVRNGVLLRTCGPGPERDAIVSSQWVVGGSALLMLSIAMGLEPFRLPFSVQMVTLGVSVVVTGIGTIKTRRLTATRRQRLLAATESPTTLADRIEALEVRRAQHRGVPIKFRIVTLGSKAVIAGSAAWAASLTASTGYFPYFSLAALGAVAWIGWDVLVMARSRKARVQYDGEIAELLAAPQDGGTS